MTTIAIIGGGIAARSLLFVMAKRKISQKILVFYSDQFAFPCSLHSTAIVAPRGISTGHSPLGDVLVEGFSRFSQHVKDDSPQGVFEIPQYTGAITKLDAFQKRYPKGDKKASAGPVRFKDEVYLAEERAFLIQPRIYLDWLLSQTQSLDIRMIPSLVTEIHGNKLKTQEGEEFSVDKIIFTGGVYNSLWFPLFDLKKSTKSVQGCYLEFTGVDFGKDSFSLTLEGDNLVYDGSLKTLLIGSTTNETILELPQETQLKGIYQRISERIVPALPDFELAVMRTGLREKASRREAYTFKNGIYSVIGGLYKNGYRLSLTMAEKCLEL